MDGDRFDVLVGSWAARSRRGVVRALAGLALGAAVGLVRPGGAAAAKCTRKCRDRHVNERKVERLIKKAGKRYNQSPKKLLKVARCESNLDPCAENRRGETYGLFQFLCSTWKSTPYGDENMYDPRANALAAAWMWKQGRQNEWVCQP